MVSEPNYYSTKFFTENLLEIEMWKTQIFINKPFYLGLSILELSKIVLYDIMYDYVKPKYEEKSKLYYMDTDSFTVYIKTDDIYKDSPEDVGKKLQTMSWKDCYQKKEQKGFWLNEGQIKSEDL